MLVYYQDRHVRITSKGILADGRYYPLDQMEQIWRTGGRIAHTRIMAGVGVLLFAVGARVAASYTWWTGGLRRQEQRLVSSGVAGVVAVGLIGLAIAVLGVIAIEAVLRAIEDIRGHRRRLELWAHMGGQPVMVWSTNDALRFGRVCRALNRAWGASPRPTRIPGSPRITVVRPGRQLPDGGGTNRPRRRPDDTNLF